MLRLIVCILVAIVAASPAQAHTSDVAAIEPGWTMGPSILVPLVLSLFMYVSGSVRLLRRSIHARRELRRRWRLFFGGWLTLVVAAVSPLHQAGEMSFTLHMIEHELFMLVAAPLLVLSRPLETMLWSLPPRWRRRVGGLIHARPVDATWRLLRGAAFATALQAAVLWIWHAPHFFEVALESEAWHVTQHLCFLFSALLFWSAMLRDRNVPSRIGIAVLCLFATSIVSGALGALMTFSASPWYPRYAMLALAAFGLTPMEDQQLAGLLMWIPGGVVHAGAALLLLNSLTRLSSTGSRATIRRAAVGSK